MSADTAPAAMPGEEDVARVLDPDSWRHLEEARSTGVVPFINAMERAVEPSFTTARAVLDLFAPILAEKEREIEAWQSHYACANGQRNRAEAALAQIAAPGAAMEAP